MNLTKLKSLLGAKSDEDLFGLSEYPQPTIDVDEIIKKLDQGTSWISRYVNNINDSFDSYDIDTYTSDINNEIDNIAELESDLISLKLYIEKLETIADEWKFFATEVLDEDEEILLSRVQSKYKDKAKIINNLLS